MGKYDDVPLGHQITYAREKFDVVGQPIHMSRYPQPATLRPTPDQGQHTDEVLRELGYDAAAIAELRASGVV